MVHTIFVRLVSNFLTKMNGSPLQLVGLIAEYVWLIIMSQPIARNV